MKNNIYKPSLEKIRFTPDTSYKTTIHFYKNKFDLEFWEKKEKQELRIKKLERLLND